MTRVLNTTTLDGAVKYHTGLFFADQGKFNRDFVLDNMQNFHFKDEYEYVLAGMRKSLAGDVLAEFNRGVTRLHKPRSDKTFKDLLKQRLAVDVNGKHIDGAIGLVQVDSRIVGAKPYTVKTNRGEYALVKNVYWPIYAGETDERLAGRVNEKVGESNGADPLPEGTPGMPVGATNPNISAALAIILADAVATEVDSGSTAATINGRTGAQPVDPDAAETGTLLFTLTMSATAFGAATDVNPGGQIAAAAITDDASADATNTLSYCRVAATGTGADDVIDGEAGTSASDFNFNTLSIVSGSTVSMSAMTITMPQGATAT